MPAGRPKKDNVTLQIRVPKKYITIAEQLHIDYRKEIKEVLELLVSVAIEVPLGETPCEEIRNCVIRNVLIEKALKERSDSIARR